MWTYHNNIIHFYSIDDIYKLVPKELTNWGRGREEAGFETTNLASVLIAMSTVN